jgi:hypothetical protein
VIDDPGFQLNPFWLAMDVLAFLLFVAIVVWLVRYAIRARRRQD